VSTYNFKHISELFCTFL